MTGTVIGIPAFVAKLRGALADAERRGSPWKTTRFGAYIEILDAAAALTYPCPFPWKDDADKQRTLFEAASQCQQLIEGVEVLASAEDDVALDRLRRLMRGPALPTADPDAPDDARNTLFELATASALRRGSFAVEVPRHGEDLRASYDGLLPFIVECKRPTHDGSLLKNLKKARHQLKARRQPEQDYGLVVIGIDRIVGLSGEAPVVESEAVLLPAVERTISSQMCRIQEVQQQTGEKLFPHASLFGVLLVGAVFPADRGGLFALSKLHLSCAGSESHKTSVKIMAALRGTIPFGSVR